MILREKDVLSRLGSPDNLLNRLRSSPSGKAMSLFIPDKTSADKKVEAFNPFEKFEKVNNTSLTHSETETEASDNPPSEPELDHIVNDAEDKIKLELAHNQALDTLNRAVAMLSTKLDDVKPEKLPAVITATSKVVEGIRKERLEARKSTKGQAVHLHFYTPSQKKMEEYKVIDVG